MALAIGGFRVVTESKIDGHPRYDLPGVLTSTLGVALMVYGATQAEGHGWRSFEALGPLVAGLALVASFVVIEHRSAQPLLPLSSTPRPRQPHPVNTTLNRVWLDPPTAPTFVAWTSPTSAPSAAPASGSVP